MEVSWDDLRVYLAIQEKGSLAGAGRVLGLDPTTVGRRLDRLEQARGTRLFIRSPGAFSPTEAGRMIHEHVARMARSAGFIERTIDGSDAKLSGRVRISTTDTFATHFLLKHFAAFHSQYPDIRLEIVIRDQRADLSRGEVDVALRFAKIDQGIPLAAAAESSVMATRMGTINIGIYASRAYLDRMGPPATPFAVEGHSLICPEPVNPHFPGAQWVLQVRERGKVALTVDSTAALAAGVASGLGLGALACFQAPDHPELVRVCPGVVVDSRALWLLVPLETRRIARVRAVVDFLTDTLAAWSNVMTGT
jgi:DNA-binding transcriptional LysR family regulator